jgi:hypothetical protein
MEILDETETRICAKIKGFGEGSIHKRPRHEVSVDDYIRFFDKKWTAIAEYMGLEYRQYEEGDWVILTVTKK